MRASYRHRRFGDTGASEAGWLILLICVLVLAPVIFGGLVPHGMRNLLLAVGCVLSALLFVQHTTFNLLRMGVTFGWLLLAVLALYSRAATGGSFSFAQMTLPLIALTACFSTCSTSWLKYAMRTVLVMLEVHLLATLLFYAVPTLYFKAVKPLFFATSKNAVGYQSGLTTHYSNNGFLMATGFLLLSCSAICASYERKPNRIVLASLFFFGLLLTQKRAHITFAVLSIWLAYLLFGAKRWALKSTMTAIGIICALIVISHYVPGVEASLERLGATFESADFAEATSGRTYLWAEALRGWNEHPLFGNGWGSYAYVWPGGNVTIYAHNEVLQLLHDVGLVGTLLFGWAAFSSLSLARRNVKKLRHSQLQYTSIELTAALFAYTFELFCLLYACTTGILFQQPLVYTPYLLAVGMSIAIRNHISNMRNQPKHMAVRKDHA